MSESKYWWVFIDMYGEVEYQYGTLCEAAGKANTGMVVTATIAEWRKGKSENDS